MTMDQSLRWTHHEVIRMDRIGYGFAGRVYHCPCPVIANVCSFPLADDDAIVTVASFYRYQFMACLFHPFRDVAARTLV